MQLSIKAPSVMRRLAYKVLSTLTEDFIKKEFKAVSTKVEMVTDEIINEFTNYQLKTIPKSYCEVNTTTKPTSSKVRICIGRMLIVLWTLTKLIVIWNLVST